MKDTRVPEWETTPGQTERIVSAMQRVQVLMRMEAWKWATRHQLNPAQLEALEILALRDSGMSLSWLATQLGVSQASASDTVSALVRKGLVVRDQSEEDKRTREISLTHHGRELIQGKETSESMIQSAIDSLPKNAGEDLFRSLMLLITELQHHETFPEMRTCPSCRFFQAAPLSDSRKSSFCLLVGADLPTRLWRVDCAEHQRADDVQFRRARTVLQE